VPATTLIFWIRWLPALFYNAQAQGMNPMSNKHLWSRCHISVIATLPLFVALSGCAERRVPVYPVSGKITYKGQPPVGATVVLHSLNGTDTKDVAPAGTVTDDGSFTITSYELGDGAPQSDYVATIEWYKYQSELGGAGPNVIPSKYVSAKTSPVRLSVSGGPAQIAPIIIK
jgi:hypothetical protein